MSSNHATIDLYGFLLMELVFAVFSIVDLVPLLHWGRAPVNDSLLLQVQVCWLIVSPEVLNVELEPAQLDCVTASEAMIVQEAIFVLIFVLLLRLRFDISNDNKHHASIGLLLVFILLDAFRLAGS